MLNMDVLDYGQTIIINPHNYDGILGYSSTFKYKGLEVCARHSININPNCNRFDAIVIYNILPHMERGVLVDQKFYIKYNFLTYDYVIDSFDILKTNSSLQGRVESKFNLAFFLVSLVTLERTLERKG